MDKRVLIFIVCISATLLFVNQWFSPNDKKAPSASTSIQTENVIPTTSASESDASLPVSKEEQFYVIENDYEQLVFSNFGGALSEINLKLSDKKNPDLAIRPIRFEGMQYRRDIAAKAL